mmetsp:Transcript_81734/g.187014  ORF Transcript_81734/g.187014 Transcript_81734/m.187014 type:complete len:300 (-) Transcript_81734:660-1559(-)
MIHRGGGKHLEIQHLVVLRRRQHVESLASCTRHPDVAVTEMDDEPRREQSSGAVSDADVVQADGCGEGLWAGDTVDRGRPAIRRILCPSSGSLGRLAERCSLDIHFLHLQKRLSVGVELSLVQSGGRPAGADLLVEQGQCMQRSPRCPVILMHHRHAILLHTQGRVSVHTQWWRVGEDHQVLHRALQKQTQQRCNRRAHGMADNHQPRLIGRTAKNFRRRLPQYCQNLFCHPLCACDKTVMRKSPGLLSRNRRSMRNSIRQNVSCFHRASHGDNDTIGNPVANNAKRGLKRSCSKAQVQ